jgi:integrase
MAKRRANGEGTISRRKDGRYEAALYVPTANGRRKRIHIYARTREAAHEKLISAQQKARQGIPVADVSQRLDSYLSYWLEHVVRTSKRMSTYAQYDWLAEHYLKPELGSYRLDKLSVPIVQQWLDQKFAEGVSAHRVHALRKVLGSALTRAMQEDLVQRNVARIASVPSYQARERVPWSADETKRFLAATADHELYPPFLVLILYGLRRGEVLGLRWGDVDFEAGMLHIRNQLQRVAGSFRQGPPKTHAGKRELPLLAPVREVLLNLMASSLPVGPRDISPEALVFVTELSGPRDPDGFGMSFKRLSKRNGLRIIRVHDVRHTTATILHDLGIPARDAQVILGHANITTTQQIYQHSRLENQQHALEQVESALLPSAVCERRAEDSDGATRCRQTVVNQDKDKDAAPSPGAALTSVAMW